MLTDKELIEELNNIKRFENISALDKAVKLLGKYQKLVTNKSELVTIKDVRSTLNGLYFQLKKEYGKGEWKSGKEV